jgi:epoxyqueuosine reductase
LADEMTALIGPFGYRVFSDSAPVMEVHFASQAGLGRRGKHTLLLSKQGSWRFLGEIYCDLPLPPDSPIEDHCGTCTACLDACPTKAIIAPYQVDARRCISYLTIELNGPIPEEFRPLIGNRIYGCDDCQLCCPWNRFAQLGDPEFRPRHGLDDAGLIELFAWTEDEFNERLAGNPIRRIGHERWLRNIAVALGNCPPGKETLSTLVSRLEHPSPLVREHVLWAIAHQQEKLQIFSPASAPSQR